MDALFFFTIAGALFKAASGGRRKGRRFLNLPSDTAVNPAFEPVRPLCSPCQIPDDHPEVSSFANLDADEFTDKLWKTCDRWVG